MGSDSVIVDKEGSVQELSAQTKLEAGRFTVQQGRDRTVVQNFPTSTVAEISNVELGNHFQMLHKCPDGHFLVSTDQAIKNLN